MTSPTGTGPRRPAPARTDPGATGRATRQVMHFALLVLGSLVVTPLGLPGRVASLLLAVAAVVVGVRALVAVVRAGVRGMLVPVLAVGLGFSLVMVASLAATLAFWPVEARLQQCLRDALTISAQERCQDQYQEDLRDLQRRLEDRLDRARTGG